MGILADVSLSRLDIASVLNSLIGRFSKEFRIEVEAAYAIRLLHLDRHWVSSCPSIPSHTRNRPRDLSVFPTSSNPESIVLDFVSNVQIRYTGLSLMPLGSSPHFPIWPLQQASRSLLDHDTSDCRPHDRPVGDRSDTQVFVGTADGGLVRPRKTPKQFQQCGTLLGMDSY